jgi:SulP family sulfate permease
LIAGVTLAAIAIPEQMATSKLGGFTPEIGFFAFIAGSLGFALLGANRFLSAGADSTITPIFAGGLALLATSGTPDYQALAAALALRVGLLLMGTAHHHERPRATGSRSNDRDAAPSLVGEGAASAR